MKNKRGLILCMFFVFTIILIGFISSQSSYCCEKLKNGGPWCQNAAEDQCDENYRKAPTSCESTSYCRLGTCINSREGDCIERTPQRTCDPDEGGVWKPESALEIPQCQLGCCLIGKQAAFVTQTRCNRLSSAYGLNIDYRSDINNEAMCIASATAGVEGACVFEREFTRTCKRLNQEECAEIELGAEAGTVSFHPGYLCSAEELGADCGPSEKTACIEGYDEVFYLDTCGNTANVYDAAKVNDRTYWTYITGYREVDVDCGSGSNAGSRTCGDCDYYSGSTCKKAQRGDNPNYGDYICKDLGCSYDADADGTIEADERFEHGETWCIYSGVSRVGVGGLGGLLIQGTEQHDVGGRYFRGICYNGEVTVEACADFKQEICVESELTTEFTSAGCVVNKWQDCYSQEDQEDCELTRRDCKWIELETEKVKHEEGFLGFGSKDDKVTDAGGICVPKFSPGINFWGDEEGGENEVETTCSLGTRQCTVTRLEKFEGLSKDYTYYGECVDGSGDLKQSWINSMEGICQSFGDCGGKLNFLPSGQKGSHDYGNDAITKTDFKEAGGGGGGLI